MSTSELDPFDAEIMGAVDATVAAARAEIDTLRQRVAELEAAARALVDSTWPVGGDRYETAHETRLVAALRAALSSPPPHDAEPCSCGRVALDWFTSTHSKLTKEGEQFISTNHRRDRCDREIVPVDAPPPHDGEGAP